MSNPPSLPVFDTFGELLRHLRRRAQLTQRDLGQAVGYSETHITRLENGQRLPDLTVVKGLFVGALDLKHEPELASRLIEMASKARSEESLAKHERETSGRARTNLPARLTSFIGREREIEAVTQLLSENRLLTLTGAGGVGKTRLAIEVGTRYMTLNASPFTQGVWLVELAPVSDPAQVSQIILSVFGLSVEPGRSALDALTACLSNKTVLLILDNCEHLIGDCADLAERLLSACSDLRILATSREPLRVPSEITWRVPPLTVPDARAPLKMAEAQHCEAVQLFMEHARESQTTFQLASGNVGAVAQICRRLDGMPLAIEMAAAQVSAMSVHEIAAQLNSSLAVLTHGRRTAPPRHRTLRATIEWSYNLLSASERVLLSRLSVFADGCTADAARAVCSDLPPAYPLPRIIDVLPLQLFRLLHPPIPSQTATEPDVLDESAVLPLLLQLVHKSLVVADTRIGHTRYRLLETIRQFAIEKLDESGESVMLHERLADYLLSLTANRPYGPTITEHVDRQEAELGNLAALIAWLRTRPNGDEVSLTLLTHFRSVWLLRGYLMEAQAWLDDALLRAANISVDLRVASLVTRLTLLFLYGYSRDRWAAQAEEAVALTNDSEERNTSLRLYTLAVAGNAAWERSDLDRAKDYFEQGLRLGERTHHKPGIVHSLLDLSLISIANDDLVVATTAIRRALQIAQEMGSETDVLLALLPMALVDPVAALVLCRDEVIRQRELGNAEDLAIALQAYAHQLLHMGNDTQAETILHECLMLWRGLGVLWNYAAGSARTLKDLGQVAWRRGDLIAARDWYEQSLKEYHQMGIGGQIAHVHALIGHVLLAEGDHDGATGAFRRSLDAYVELGNAVGISMVLTGLGALAEAQGLPETAARLFGSASIPRATYAMPLQLWPADRNFYLAEIEAARKRYEAMKYAAAWAEGERMTLQQAVAYARNTWASPANPRASYREI